MSIKQLFYRFTKEYKAKKIEFAIKMKLLQTQLNTIVSNRPMADASQEIKDEHKNNVIAIITEFNKTKNEAAGYYPEYKEVKDIKMSEELYRPSRVMFQNGGIIAKREYNGNIAAEIMDNAVKKGMVKITL